MQINSSSNVNAVAYQIMESNLQLSREASAQAQQNSSQTTPAAASDSSAQPVSSTTSTGGIDTYA